MSEEQVRSSQPDWEAFRQWMGYSPAELEAFCAHANNAYVVEHAWRLDEWVIVAEVIEAHGCSAQHKVGDKLYISPHGTLQADKGPARVCLQALPGLAAAVAVIQERIISGLDPEPYLCGRVGCLDVGVRCGGWGHIALELRALRRD